MNNWFYDIAYKKKEKQQVNLLNVDGVPDHLLNNMAKISTNTFFNSDNSIMDKAFSLRNWAVAGLFVGLGYSFIYKKNTLLSSTIGAATFGTIGYILKSIK
jgi:hypothetical protein